MKKRSGQTALSLFEPEPFEGMPTTRYQGSKRKVLGKLYGVFSGLRFETCLDAFGGTGSVTHLLSQMKKSATYNDILPFNTRVATALFSEGSLELTRKEVTALFEKNGLKDHKTHISDLYSGIYFTDEENIQIDLVVQNILRYNSALKRSEAFYCLFQSLISKRPYNLFHRANLHVRTKEVERSFGNKVTWDRPILDHMLNFYSELDKYRTEYGSGGVKILNNDAFQLNGTYDLVYLDTPYAKSAGNQESNYFNFYHFLDALVDYYAIPQLINEKYAHRPIYAPNRQWYEGVDILEAFDRLFKLFPESQLVISYRDDGFPTIEDLKRVLWTRGREVAENEIGEYKYVLASERRGSKEVVLVAGPEKIIPL